MYFESKKLIPFFGLTLGLVNSCSDNFKLQSSVSTMRRASCVEGSFNCANIESLSPMVLVPGAIIKFKGKNLPLNMSVMIDGIKVSPVSASDSEQSFILPEGKDGYVSIESSVSANLLGRLKAYRLTHLSMPVATLESSEICAHIEFYDAKGVLNRGTQDCSKLSAEDRKNLTPDNLKAGVVIADITGTMDSAASLSSCSTSGQSNCITTDLLPAMRLSSLAQVCSEQQSVATIVRSAPLSAITNSPNITLSIVNCADSSAILWASGS